MMLLTYLHKFIFLMPAALIIICCRPPASGQVYYPTTEHITVTAEEEAVYYAIKEGAVLYASDKDSAMMLILKGIETSQDLRFGDGIFTGFFLLGILHIYQGDYESAKLWLEKATKQASLSSKMATNICRALNNLGNVQHFQGNYQKAAEYYFHAIHIAENALYRDKDTNVINPLIRIYTSTANALLQLNETQKAMTFLGKAESLTKQMGYTANLPAVYVNKANVFKKTGDFKTAWKYNQQALVIAQQFSLNEPEHIALQNLGELLMSSGKHTQAIGYLNKALAVKGYVNPYYEIQTLLSLGVAYLSLNNYIKSEQALVSAYEKADSLKIPGQLLLIHQQLATLYKSVNHYRKAYSHQYIAYQINDSLLNNEKTKAVSLLEIKYRTAEKEKEITQKQLLINNQQRTLENKNVWIIGISSGALLLTARLGRVYSLYYNNRQKHRLQNEKIRTLQQQQEIDLLKALMAGEEKERVRIAQDLHDGIVVQFTAAKMSVRSLSSQYKELADSESFKHAVDQLDNATRDLRQTAHNLLPDVLLEDGLAEAVYYFCRNLKQSAGLNIDFQLYGQIPRLTPDFELSLYRIIQELVHNVIKHAKATNALVQITYQDQHLCITVEDDGAGIPPALLHNKKGLGLRNIFTRVQTLMGQIDISSRPGNGTIVYLDFDMQHIFNPTYPGLC